MHGDSKTCMIYHTYVGGDPNRHIRPSELLLEISMFIPH